MLNPTQAKQVTEMSKMYEGNDSERVTLPVNNGSEAVIARSLYSLLFTSHIAALEEERKYTVSELHSCYREELSRGISNVIAHV